MFIEIYYNHLLSLLNVLWTNKIKDDLQIKLLLFRVGLISVFTEHRHVACLISFEQNRATLLENI